MIVVRDIFRLKFGKARDAAAVCKEAESLMKGIMKDTPPPRVMTDLIGGEYYTLVMEQTFESLAAYEESARAAMSDPRWREWYQKFVPLAEGGHREILNVIA